MDNQNNMLVPVVRNFFTLVSILKFNFFKGMLWLFIYFFFYKKKKRKFIFNLSYKF